jgi:hypothetical protein
LKSDLNSFTGRNRRLLDQLTQLREQHSLLWTQSVSRRNEIDAKCIELDTLTRERDLLKVHCEDTKARILETVTQLQDCPADAISALLAERARLDAEVDEERRRVERLRHEHRGLDLRLNAQAAQRTREREQAMSPVRWSGERSALQVKVKRARQELALLGSLEKSAVRTATACQKKTESLAYSSDDVKRAILCETATIAPAPSQFLIDAIGVEQHYAAGLKRQLAELDAIERRIAEFRPGHDAVLGGNETVAENAERIATLNEELKEIIAAL